MGEVSGSVDEKPFDLTTNPQIPHPSILGEILVLSLDPAHVMKIGRNIIFGSQFKKKKPAKEYNGYIAWDYIVGCYENDKKNVTN